MLVLIRKGEYQHQRGSDPKWKVLKGKDGLYRIEAMKPDITGSIYVPSQYERGLKHEALKTWLMDGITTAEAARRYINRMGYSIVKIADLKRMFACANAYRV